MIYLIQSHNNLINNLKQSLISTGIDNAYFDIEQNEKPEVDSLFIFFQDPYKDNHENYLRDLEKLLEICKNTGSKLIYIDTVHLYGLTEYTKVDESHPHVPYKTISNIRESAYDILKSDQEVKKLILRFPDLLGRNCNIFFDDFFNAKSNFLNWSGSTSVTHEFLYFDDAVNIILNFTQSNFTENFNEYNISGTKYTIEQIAARINELFMINVKINHYSPLLLFLKSFSDTKLKIIYENTYLYKKPVFLNSAKYENEFGEIKKTSLDEILGNMLNSK